MPIKDSQTPDKLNISDPNAEGPFPVFPPEFHVEIHNILEAASLSDFLYRELSFMVHLAKSPRRLANCETPRAPQGIEGEAARHFTLDLIRFISSFQSHGYTGAGESRLCDFAGAFGAVLQDILDFIRVFQQVFAAFPHRRKVFDVFFV